MAVFEAWLPVAGRNGRGSPGHVRAFAHKKSPLESGLWRASRLL